VSDDQYDDEVPPASASAETYAQSSAGRMPSELNHPLLRRWTRLCRRRRTWEVHAAWRLRRWRLSV